MGMLFKSESRTLVVIHNFYYANVYLYYFGNSLFLNLYLKKGERVVWCGTYLHRTYIDTLRSTP
jgi:hypothetical protein